MQRDMVPIYFGKSSYLLKDPNEMQKIFVGCHGPMLGKYLVTCSIGSLIARRFTPCFGLCVGVRL